MKRVMILKTMLSLLLASAGIGALCGCANDDHYAQPHDTADHFKDPAAQPHDSSEHLNEPPMHPDKTVHPEAPSADEDDSDDDERGAAPERQTNAKL